MKPLPSSDLSGQTRGGNRIERRRSKRGRKATARRRWLCTKCKKDHGAARPAGACECGSTKIVQSWVRFEVRLEPRERDAWIFCAGREGYLSVSDWIRDTCNGRVRSRPLTSSDIQSHNTPQEILDVIEPMGPIALDPCSNENSIVPARVKWTEADDSLPRSWLLLTGDFREKTTIRRSRSSSSAPAPVGIVYVNPPYGDELPTWIAKMVEQAKCGAEIVALVPARPDTQWFELAQDSADVGLWRGRITYGGSTNPAPFPICLLYFGPRRALFRRAVEPHCVRVLDAADPVWRRAKVPSAPVIAPTPKRRRAA